MSYFPRTSAEINISEARVTAPMADYERIHAKIVRGVNRQVEGDKEVQDGLKEMVSTKAYQKKYKSLAAYAEGEFGKSKSWIYDRLKTLIPENRSEAPLLELESLRGQELDSKPDKPEAKEKKPLSKKPATEVMEEHAGLVAPPAKKDESNQVPVACPRCHGSGWIGEQPKYRPEPCKCGCVLTVEVCQKLFEQGIPSVGLTVGQAGLLMGKIAANNWELPKAFEFAKNQGEWVERKWRKQ